MTQVLTQLDFFESQTAIEGASSKEEAPVFFPELRGRIEKIVSFDETTGQCVLDVRCEPSHKPLLISTKLPRVWPGLTFTARRSDTQAEDAVCSVTDVKLGEPMMPRTLKKFLKSRPFGPLGKSVVDSLARAFPGEIFSVLEDAPERLRHVRGIGKARAKHLLARWSEFREQSKIDQFLFKENLPLSWSSILQAIYKEQAIETFTAHPYLNVHDHGFAFEIVDAFALRQGTRLDDPERLSAGLGEIIHRHFQQGHCACPDNQLINEASAQLFVSREKVEDALELAILRGELVTEVIGETTCIYQREAWQLEQDVAKRLLEFTTTAFHPLTLNPTKMVSWAQRFLDLKLSERQTLAVEETLRSPLTVITGGPGTGKTTLIRCLVSILQAQSIRYALCAPTGRAAQRLTETAGSDASTIHRLLQFNGQPLGTRRSQFGLNRGKPLDIEMLLVDEASMIDLSLMSHLLEALPRSCALVLIGDASQLPSVGAGTVLQSLISSKKFPVVELTDIFRQQSGSGIRFNADRIRNGHLPVNGPTGSHDFRYLPVKSDAEILPLIKTVLLKTLRQDCGVRDLNHVQILTPMNQGAFGSRRLNEELRDLFNPRFEGETPERLSRSGYRCGDRVMVNKNDYQKNVFNGDVGLVCAVREEFEILEVVFANRTVSFDFAELSSLSLAYAISIHKSQGSEYRAVVVVLNKSHLPLAQRHLIYTAVTRGKTHVFLIADPETLKSAIVRSEKRWQNLTALLSQ